MDRPALDVEQGVAACAGSPELLREVASMLDSSLDGRIGEVRAALAAGNLTEAGRLSHRHKGACLTCGALALAATFAAVDHAARAGDQAGSTAAAEGLPAAAAAFRAARTAL
jgi:HPt (histidine-containing phosphotransfer) domain-containing protein